MTKLKDRLIEQRRVLAAQQSKLEEKFFLQIGRLELSITERGDLKITVGTSSEVLSDVHVEQIKTWLNELFYEEQKPQPVPDPETPVDPTVPAEPQPEMPTVLKKPKT